MIANHDSNEFMLQSLFLNIGNVFFYASFMYAYLPIFYFFCKDLSNRAVTFVILGWENKATNGNMGY